MFSSIGTIEEILNSLFYLGLFYSTYAWLQFYGKDPITLILPWWKRPGEPIMLTLGNSNFASILLAMTFSGTLVKLIKSSFTKPAKYISCISIFSHYLLIRKIDTQGKIAFAVGFVIIIFAFLFYSKDRLLRVIGAFWGVGGVFTGIFGVLALFNVGFFENVIRKFLFSLFYFISINFIYTKFKNIIFSTNLLNKYICQKYKKNFNCIVDIVLIH
jgi:membrane-bound ClpP family serine protease